MIKSAKISVISGFIICCAIGVVVALVLERQPRKSDFSLTSYQRITFVDGISFLHAPEMDQILSGLPMGKTSVATKPDCVLLLYSSSSQEPRFLSFFLKEGFVLDGNYLDAWTERMEGKTTAVYLLSSGRKAKIAALFPTP